MGELYGTCALLAAVLFFVLLQKFESRFGKVDKELGEIKKRMDDLLKAQEKMASGPVRDVTAETLDNTDILPYVTEELPDSTVTALKEEKAVEEKAVEGIQPIMAETTPQKLNASLEKESAEATLQETSPEAPLEIPSVSKRKQVNYEKFIGENLFGKIGILVFVIGVGFFVKYAIDKDWINETLRTVLGFLTGSALLVVAERLQKKYRTFSSLLAGGAFAVFYLTVAIAFHFYHLFPQTVAFIILIATTLFMSILSILYDRRELAIISLVGGFLAPFLVSTGNGNYLVLFTYMSILNLGMFGLSIYMKWGELPVIAFVFTYVVMGIFLLTGFTTGSTHISVHLFIFATLFYFIFLLPILSILRIEAVKKNRGLLLVIITNNFIYLLLGILFLRNMGLPFKSEGLLSLLIAIINLVLVIWLRMSKKDYKFLIYAMLGLVLTFVSITIPIQLDGNYITLFWAAEMVLLLWLYVKSKIGVYERATQVLMGLTLVSYLMDIYNVLMTSSSSETIFLNSSFATSLFVGLATGAFALLMGRYRSLFTEARYLRYTPWNSIMLLAAAAILYYTFMAEFALHLAGATRSGMMLAFTSAAIFILSYTFKKRFPIKQYTIPYLTAMGMNVLIYVINIWGDQWVYTSLTPALLRWFAAAFVIANLYYVARQYYTLIGLKTPFTVYLNVLALFLWLTMARSFLLQAGVEDFDAGFSVSLSIAGFIQMALGMRLHQKVLRIISLSTFGIVLLKLILKDLWAMPTIGKIIVFIILGLILLILSFLYQKLKDVLFKNDEDETD